MTGPPAGTRLGRYELVRAIGAGGQGRVYEAVMHGPGGLTRRVALKVVRGGSLHREARLGGLLRHPNLVDVYEVAEHDGAGLLAMELCRHGTLAHRPPLPPRAVVEVGLQVCAALAYAHEELGLVHLDLKPGNLLLEGPVVKVADLGISRTADARAGRPRVAGTRGYMAPEHVAGGAVDARADVYALGVVLQELATGRPAAAPTTLVLEVAPEDEGPALGTPVGWLAPVLGRCLAPDPADRFGSMAELAAALRSLDAPGPSLADALHLGPIEPAGATNLGQEEDLVGRAADLAALLALLAEPGPVTVAGPPGIGKTALARATLREHRHRSGCEAWFCDLSAIRTLEGIAATVARVLDVPLGDADADTAVVRIGHALAARGEVAVVLDNFEQVAAHAGVVARWCAVARRARIVVTTRHELGLPVDRSVRLAPLTEEAAAELVVTRARQRGVDLVGDPGVHDLARRLDGVPLALELAAGRVGVLSLAEVLERLSLSMLRSGRAGQADREATLRGALDWSFALLDEAERDAMAQLSVFQGDFAEEAAEAVLGVPAGSPGSPAVLASLRDRFLVLARGGRLRLLEPVREYAAQALGEGRRSAEERHGAWYAAYGGEEAIAATRGPEGPARRRALATELPNLGIACRRAVERGDAAVATATLRGVWAATLYTGPFPVVAELADLALSCPGLAGRDRARVHEVAGYSFRAIGRRVDARARLEEARAAFAACGAAVEEAVVAGQLGNVALDEGRTEEALALLEGAAARLEALDDRHGRRTVIGNLANALFTLGRLDEAQAAYQTALALHREAGDRRHEGVALGNLGVLHYERGRLEEARRCHEGALVVARDVGDLASEAYRLGSLGSVHASLGQVAEAAVLLEASLALHRQTGNVPAQGHTLANLAGVRAMQRRVDEARAGFEAALVVHRGSASRAGEAHVLHNLGVLLLEQEGPDAARACLERALALQREVRHAHGVAQVLGSLGHLEREIGRLAEARACYDEALVLHRSLGDARAEGAVLAYQARLAAAEGRLDEARELLADAGRVATSDGDPTVAAIVLVAEGDVLRCAGDRAGADEALRRAERLAPHEPELARDIARVRTLARP